eukprot:m.308853 g.308853  ORF g.308853 m.308853 type:complete len:513 (+) comp44965_c0_seq1:149-1687(+)
MDGKRKLSSTSDGEAIANLEDDVPRKKSRNYLDSHKSIEKKRRDRINNSLSTLKELVPDCKQYGTKKLDKAEILEMCIEYLRRLQAHYSQHGDVLATSPRDFATEVSTWILQHKQQHTELDSFIQAQLLFLSAYGSVAAQRQQQLYASSQSSQGGSDLLSPVTSNLSGMAIMASPIETQSPHGSSFPPPYRGLDLHHQHAPQVHRPPSSAAQRFGDDPQVQDLWRTQAMMQHLQQQGFHVSPGDHDPPPLVQPPDSLSGHQDVKGSTQPLHHLVMQPGSGHQSNYAQMIVLPQTSTRPLHHPVSTSEETNQQIQQFLDAYTKSGVGVQSRGSIGGVAGGGASGGGEVILNAQDIVHHQIQQQMRMAQPVTLIKPDAQSSQTKTPLPGTETLVMGMSGQGASSLTEELLDSGTSVPPAAEPTGVVSEMVESANWGATQVAMETTVDSSWKLELPTHPEESSAEKGNEEEQEDKKEDDQQPASTLLMLANGKKESTEQQEQTPPAAEAHSSPEQ